MDLCTWLALGVVPLTLGLLGVKMYTYKPSVETLNGIASQQMAKIAREIGLRHLSPDLGERRRDIMRQQYLNLRKAGLTSEDLDWVAEQMKLTGFDPTRQRWATDHRDTYLAVGSRWPKGML